jgi:hypothetical protein
MCSIKMRDRGRQLNLPAPRTWGGRRDGAGRKPAPGRRRVSHRRRAAHDRHCPVHVTLRASDSIPSLRRETSSGPYADRLARHQRRTSAFSTSACSTITCTYSSKPTGAARSAAASRGSPFAWRRQSIACSAAAERSGSTAIMPARSLPRARSGMRSSTSCRTSESICAESADLIRGRPRRGSRGGGRR